MSNLMLQFEMVAAFAAACPEGFTIDKNTFEPIRKGYAVAVKETQESFGNAGLAKVIAYVANHLEIQAFGGWYNSDNGQFYYDATIIVDDLATAYDLAKLNNQLAFFDLSNEKQIWV